MYTNGKGVKQDHNMAIKYCKLAADQGDANALSKLGVMYRYGQGVKQDHSMAIKYYKLAAEQGLEQANSLLQQYFTVGMRVIVVGLKSNSNLNRPMGTIKRELPNGRVAVTLDGHAKPQSIRYLNLSLLE